MDRLYIVDGQDRRFTFFNPGEAVMRMTGIWGFFVLFLFMGSTGLFGMEDSRPAEEFPADPPVMLFGIFPVEEDIRELKVLRDMDGGIYILYIAGGEFKVIHGDNTGHFGGYAVPGFDGVFQNPRGLAVSAGGFKEYAAFMADAQGWVNIYLFAVDSLGELTCRNVFAAGPGDRPVDFRLGESYLDTYSLFVTTGGRLSCISGHNEPNSVFVRQDISAQGETVGGYGVIKKPESAERYGWYAVPRAGLQDICLFLLRDNGLLSRQILTGYSPDAGVTLIPDLQGTVRYTITDDRKVEVIQGTLNGFVKETAVSGPEEAVDYFTGPCTGLPCGLLIGRTGEAGTLYLVLEEGSAIPDIRRLDETAGSGIHGLFVLNQNAAALVYEREGILYAGITDPAGGRYTERGLGPAESRRYLFAKNEMDKLSVFCVDDSRNILVTYEYDGDDWRESEPHTLGDEFEGVRVMPAYGISDNPFLSYPHMLFLRTEKELIYADRAAGGGRKIGSYTDNRSRLLNETMFLTVYENNLLTVYRIGGMGS
jgi:hypothetical protein